MTYHNTSIKRSFLFVMHEENQKGPAETDLEITYIKVYLFHILDLKNIHSKHVLPWI